MASTMSSSSQTSGDAGSVKPWFMSIITRAGRRPTPPARCPNPSSCSATHLITPLPCPRTRASASSPGSSGDHRSGFAGVGGSSPVSSLQRAIVSSSDAPKSNAGASPRSSRCRLRSASVAASSTEPSSATTTP